MKWIFLLTLIAGFWTAEVFTPWAQSLAPTITKGREKKIASSVDAVSLRLATAAVRSATNQSKQPSDKSKTESPLFYAREHVAVLPRSITFPDVLKLGELMLSVEYPNAALLCLDAAYYAGKAQGLILAMDRDTVAEHQLYWTIDDAKDLVDSCAISFLSPAVPYENANVNRQLENVRSKLFRRIQGIQEALLYARDIKIKAAEAPICSRSNRMGGGPNG